MMKCLKSYFVIFIIMMLVLSGIGILTSGYAEDGKIKVGEYVTFGHYPQTADGKDQTPIEWKVLQVEDGKVLLLSRYGLDAQPYNKKTGATWEKCSLRKWLNSTFINEAFSEEEQAAIITTEVKNNEGNDTQDKVFLLSKDEDNLVQLGGLCEPTDYAVMQNVDIVIAEGKNYSCWHLRSSDTANAYAWAAILNGPAPYTVGYSQHDVDSYVNVQNAVRPALWFDSSAALSVSEKTTDRTSASVTLLKAHNDRLKGLTPEKDSGLCPSSSSDDVIPYFLNERFLLFTIPFFAGANGDQWVDPYDLKDGSFQIFGSRYVPADGDPFIQRGNTYLNNVEFCKVFESDDFLENENDSRKVLADDSYIEQAVDSYMNQVYYITCHLGDLREEEYTYIDGHPARLAIWYSDPNQYTNSLDMHSFLVSSITYARNDKVLVMFFATQIGGSDSSDALGVYSQSSWEKMPRINIKDLQTIASLINYDETKAECKQSDGDFTLASKEGKSVLSAGGKTQLLVEYSNPKAAEKKVKEKSKSKKIKESGPVEWTVINTETGESVPEVTIDSKGILAVDKGLETVQKAEVKAKSTIFHSEAVYPLTILPAATGMTVDKPDLFFYTGTDTPETVKVTLEPETVPPIGIIWKSQKEGIVDITPNDDGTAIIKPVAAGKTTVTITEPGGKNVQLNASVVVPVEQVELKLTGKQIPGGKVAAKETLTPKNAGNKKVEWSLNVDESIATINEKGQIAISKDAPVGTKIIVTCKALGAPEPVVASIEFEVTEK